MTTEPNFSEWRYLHVGVGARVLWSYSVSCLLAYPHVQLNNSDAVSPHLDVGVSEVAH